MLPIPMRSLSRFLAGSSLRLPRPRAADTIALAPSRPTSGNRPDVGRSTTGVAGRSVAATGRFRAEEGTYGSESQRSRARSRTFGKGWHL